MNLLNITYKFVTNVTKVDEKLRQQLDDEPQQQQQQIITSKMNVQELKKIAINGPINCDICDKNFLDMEKFDYHIEYEHLLLWQCKLCHDSYNTYDELVEHETKRHSNCDEDTIITTVRPHEDLQPIIFDHNYLDMDTVEIEINTQLENTITDDPNDYQSSQQLPTAKPICISPINLYHKDTEKENELFNSIDVETKPQCSSSSTDINNCQQIQSTRFKCKYCNRNYASYYYLQRHLIDNHPMSDNDNKQETSRISYECNICDKHFTVARNLATHMKIHSKDGQCKINKSRKFS